MKFALFFLGEYAKMIVISAVAVTLFLGGWLRAVPERRRHCDFLGAGAGGRRCWFLLEGLRVHLRLHLVPRHVPALPLRSAHGPRLEVDDPARARQHRRHRVRDPPRPGATDGLAVWTSEAVRRDVSAASSTEAAAATARDGAASQVEFEAEVARQAALLDLFDGSRDQSAPVQEEGDDPVSRGAQGAGGPLPRHVPARRGALHQVHDLRASTARSTSSTSTGTRR